MKRTLACTLVAFLSLIVAAQAADKETAGATEKAIAALEQKWIDAAKASNPDALAPMLSDKFIDTNSDGKVGGKKETLASIKGSKWEVTQIRNVKVTVFGNIAIASGDWHGNGTDDTGAKVDTHERWTDTWLKTPDGKWQCVASQGTTVKM